MGFITEAQKCAEDTERRGTPDAQRLRAIEPHVHVHYQRKRPHVTNGQVKPVSINCSSESLARITCFGRSDDELFTELSRAITSSTQFNAFYLREFVTLCEIEVGILENARITIYGINATAVMATFGVYLTYQEVFT